jgi:hypothetical protein
VTTPRRKCKLAETSHDVDLREYEDIIIATVNTITPNKNPKVFKEYFSTDVLTQSEAVSLGRALSKLEDLKVYGKTVKIFRLFDGKTYAGEEETKPLKKESN